MTLVVVLAAFTMKKVVNAAEITMILSNDNNNKGLKGKTFDFFAEEVRKRLGRPCRRPDVSRRYAF